MIGEVLVRVDFYNEHSHTAWVGTCEKVKQCRVCDFIFDLTPPWLCLETAIGRNFQYP